MVVIGKQKRIGASEEEEEGLPFVDKNQIDMLRGSGISIGDPEANVDLAAIIELSEPVGDGEESTRIRGLHIQHVVAVGEEALVQSVNDQTADDFQPHAATPRRNKGINFGVGLFSFYLSIF